MATEEECQEQQAEEEPGFWEKVGNFFISVLTFFVTIIVGLIIATFLIGWLGALIGSLLGGLLAKIMSALLFFLAWIYLFWQAASRFIQDLMRLMPKPQK